MKTAITISNDLLAVNGLTLNANSHVAEADGSNIAIVHVAGVKSKVFIAPVLSVTLNGASYTTAADFCAAFNLLAKSTPEKRNTDYPNTLISSKITVGAEKARVANHAKPGYVEIETDSENSGVVYVGNSEVTSSAAAMAADKKRFFELDDLSKLYILGSEAGQVVHVTGAYKA